MEDNKICIERELRSKSSNLIWALLSTPEGLSKWFADDVKYDNGVFTFTWGKIWSHHEIRSARVIDKRASKYIRMQWTDDGYEDMYFEMKMEKIDITGDYILIVTDFAIDGDTDTLEDIWDANFKALRRSTGI